MIASGGDDDDGKQPHLSFDFHEDDDSSGAMLIYFKFVIQYVLSFVVGTRSSKGSRLARFVSRNYAQPPSMTCVCWSWNP